MFPEGRIFSVLVRNLKPDMVPKSRLFRTVVYSVLNVQAMYSMNILSMLLSIERQYLPLVETLRNDNSLVEGVLTKLQLSFCQAIIFIADHTSLVTAEKDKSLECQLNIHRRSHFLNP